MKTIIIGFYTGNYPIDKVIAWWTYGPIVHTSITLDNITYEAKGNLNKVIKRTHKNKYNPKIHKKLQVTEKEFNTIKTFLEKCLNDKYDYYGILGFVLPTKDRTNMWFCSELVSNALKIIGRKEFMKLEPSTISPNQLYSILYGKDLVKYNRLYNIRYLFKNATM